MEADGLYRILVGKCIKEYGYFNSICNNMRLLLLPACSYVSRFLKNVVIINLLQHMPLRNLLVHTAEFVRLRVLRYLKV